MSQYPNDKAPHPDWINPPDAPFDDTLRDGAPGSSSQYDPPPPAYGSVTDYKPSETAPAPPTGPYTPGPPTAPQEEHLSLGSFFGPKGNPESWSRLPPPHLLYDAFPPMRLLSNGHDLNNGFPEVPPPCALNPHPFATHDVTEADWTRFLVDIKNAGSLSPGQRVRSGVIPLVTGMNFITGFLATRVMERRMMFSNRSAAGDLVDHWNHYFFGPRRMEVVLSQASERLSGRVEEDLSDEDEYRHYGRGWGRGHGRGGRFERTMDMRAQRLAMWGERGGDNTLPYELVLRPI